MHAFPNSNRANWSESQTFRVRDLDTVQSTLGIDKFSFENIGFARRKRERQRYMRYFGKTLLAGSRSVGWWHYPFFLHDQVSRFILFLDFSLYKHTHLAFCSISVVICNSAGLTHIRSFLATRLTHLVLLFRAHTLVPYTVCYNTQVQQSNTYTVVNFMLIASNFISGGGMVYVCVNC